MIRTISLLLFASAAFLTFVPSSGCASATEDSSATVCKPGKTYFCRCLNRQEGTHLCKADGVSYEACEPCDELSGGNDNPDQDRPKLRLDAGRDAETETSPPEDSCGDGIVQNAEECDDGNADGDDGCDANCHLSGVDPPASRSCPGMDVHVWTAPVVYAGTTVGSTNTATAKPACVGLADSGVASGSTSPDRVFRVIAHRTGTMRVAISNTTFNSFLYVTTSCEPDTKGNVSYVKCINSAAGALDEVLAFEVETGSAYSVVVDGAGLSQQGEFRAAFSIE